jgi:tetratricopeptide (TPR) repeat protein
MKVLFEDVDGEIAKHPKEIERKPENATAYLDRGYARCFNKQKDGGYTATIEDLSTAISLNDTNTECYAKRAYAYWLNGQYDRAIADCKKVPEPTESESDAQKGTAAFAKELLGNIYSNQRNYIEALEQYKAALQYNPYSPGLIDKYREACSKLNDN